MAELEAFIASSSQFKVSSPREFHTLFQDSITPETKALVSQVITVFIYLRSRYKIE